MKATIFYKTETDKSKLLVFVTRADYEQKRSLTPHIQQMLAEQQFQGQPGDVALVMDAAGLFEAAYVGVGDASSDVLALTQAALRIPAGCYHVTKSISTEALLAWSLAQYQFDRYKKVVKPPRVLVITSQQLSAVLPKATAVFLVRDLINTPTNDMGPKDLALSLETLAAAHQATFKQWVGDELLRDNFPAIHAVGRASASEPRLLSLTWGDEAHPRVTLVGKGVCFDSGGLDLKPSSGMRLMKKDMGGAAQVIGLAGWLMTECLPIRLQVLIPAVENAVGSDAYRPGDVLTMRNGLTVEIDNTDAEGRLVLADAIVKACEEKPELLIDFATLTGAARTAVGTDISAMFCNDDALAADISMSGDQVGDPVWRLPLFAGYNSLFESTIADMANSSASPYAGAITAALFLQYYVTKGLPWLHFDIMAWNVGSRPGKPEGGEAMGILAVGEYLLQRYGLSHPPSQ
ncbi:MAG: leucyl aminopeptidase family protein [Legionellaceae bacterium]|nr:leucyl aminopeptidase family protein [Legionellaceae bacterium]